MTIGAQFSPGDGGEIPPFDVGTTAPGSTIDVVITVNSAYDEPVLVDGVSVDGPAFQLSQDACTGHSLTYDSQCQVIITATPPTEGEHEGAFLVSYGGRVGAGLSLVVIGASGPP